jgi:hypothetical protein
MIKEHIHHLGIINKYVDILAHYGNKSYNKDIEKEKHMSKDMVNSPAHYNQSSIECIDSIRAALGDEGFIAYCRGNAIKYNWRAGHKVDAKEDLQKAAWYSRMASGDDPRFRPSAPNLNPVTFTGLVPPECDDRTAEQINDEANQRELRRIDG